MDPESPCTPVVVALPAEIDVANCASVAASLAGPIENAGIVIADMTGTSFCDSSGVGVLLAAHQRAAAGGCELRVAVRPGGSVARVLGIVGLDRILHVYVSVQDATPAASAVIELTGVPAPATSPIGATGPDRATPVRHPALFRRPASAASPARWP